MNKTFNWVSTNYPLELALPAQRTMQIAEAVHIIRANLALLNSAFAAVCQGQTVDRVCMNQVAQTTRTVGQALVTTFGPEWFDESEEKLLRDMIVQLQFTNADADSYEDGYPPSDGTDGHQYGDLN